MSALSAAGASCNSHPGVLGPQSGTAVDITLRPSRDIVVIRSDGKQVVITQVEGILGKIIYVDASGTRVAISAFSRAGTGTYNPIELNSVTTINVGKDDRVSVITRHPSLIGVVVPLTIITLVLLFLRAWAGAPSG